MEEVIKPIDEIPKEDIKEDAKQDIKEDAKQDIKEDAKQDIKEEIKEDVKQETKNTKLKGCYDYIYYRKLIRLFKYICFQSLIILLLLVLYINLYNCDVYDFVIYFCFGLAIAVTFIATFVMITKFNIISNNICNEFFYLSEKNTVKYIASCHIVIHLIFSIIAFIYVKKYIKRAKKTNNAFLKSLILFCIWGIYNIYINNAIKLYNKIFKTTKTETAIVTISITITYSGLLYYFETLKNEKVKLINKLINI